VLQLIVLATACKYAYYSINILFQLPWICITYIFVWLQLHIDTVAWQHVTVLFWTPLVTLNATLLTYETV